MRPRNQAGASSRTGRSDSLGCHAQSANLLVLFAGVFAKQSSQLKVFAREQMYDKILGSRGDTKCVVAGGQSHQKPGGDRY